MGKGFQKKKKQARLLQDKFAEFQEQMQNFEAEGTAGNGLVTIVLNGDGEMKNIKIKPDCVDSEDIEGLEALIKLAHKNATDKVKEKVPSFEGGFPGMGGDMPDLGKMGLGNLGGLGGFPNLTFDDT